VRRRISDSNVETSQELQRITGLDPEDLEEDVNAILITSDGHAHFLQIVCSFLTMNISSLVQFTLDPIQ